MGIKIKLPKIKIPKIKIPKITIPKIKIDPNLNRKFMNTLKDSVKEI